MNDSEIRRRELLRQTRKLYDDQNDVPAVHPRYGNIYQSLYENEEESSARGGSFYTRLVIGILCFICFVYMDQNGTDVAEVDSNVIVEQISQDMDMQMITDVWNQL